MMHRDTQAGSKYYSILINLTPDDYKSGECRVFIENEKGEAEEKGFRIGDVAIKMIDSLNACPDKLRQAALLAWQHYRKAMVQNHMAQRRRQKLDLFQCAYEYAYSFSGHRQYEFLMLRISEIQDIKAKIDYRRVVEGGLRQEELDKEQTELKSRIEEEEKEGESKVKE
jgi:hypothetical protein